VGDVPASVKPGNGEPRRQAAGRQERSASVTQADCRLFTASSPRDRFLYHVVTYNSGRQSVRAMSPKRMTIR